jgi:hypothetical protein
VGLTAAIARIMSRFDGRVVALAIAILLLTFCLVISFTSVAIANS